MMRRDTLDPQQRQIPSSITTVISRLLQREMARDHSARRRSNRRRAAAQHARDLDKLILATVSSGRR
jgi:hypothetical protein